MWYYSQITRILRSLKYGTDIRGLPWYVKYVVEHFAMTIFLELIKCIIVKAIYLVTHKC